MSFTFGIPVLGYEMDMHSFTTELLVKKTQVQSVIVACHLYIVLSHLSTAYSGMSDPVLVITIVSLT